MEHLDLPTALRQIVEAALDLVGADFGAIGVLGSDGKLAEFIHVGMDAETVRRIGSPPAGLGLLGTLIAEPRPVRLADMSGDARSVGFPPHHPPMNSFLGVPLEVRDEIFGHLYLADLRFDAFSAADQELVEALAATAGVAISHARLFEEATRRGQWTAATSRITRDLLTNDDVDALQLIAETVLGLADADLVAVVVADGEGRADTELVVDRAAGRNGGRVLGSVLPPDTLVHRCLASRRPQLVEQLGAAPMSTLLSPEHLGPAMAVPLPAGDGVRGCLFVLRSDGASVFTEFDLDVVASFAGQATLALDRADARLDRARAASLEDRDRIARDLHDHVVQRLFAAGLNIQSVCAMLGPGVAFDRLTDQVDEIDATIRQIRSTIFGLHATRHRAVGTRAMILEVITAATATLPGPPEVSFRGPIDLLVTRGLRDDVVAVVREALTNVGRHASAERVEIFVAADSKQVEVEVLDDGKGMVEGSVLSGLSNLRARAEALDGTFEMAARPGPGTRLCWTAPLPPPGSDREDAA
ncbi:GAF domain-containing protein [Nocardioides zhouii]|uniref:sensor histidine kinase n=1 Tax=Nocardioides zhouii TaxID=1168729 RepID=UPI0013ED7B24|nr:GAF domain-containing protein [Nocardioides zhouii]